MPAQLPGGRSFQLVGQGGRFGELARAGLRLRRLRVPRRFARFSGSFAISGTTRDANGVPLGGCAVHLFESATDLKVAETVSDGSGLFTFTVGTNSGTFYVVAYKPDAPDRFGTTVNTLLAT